MCCEPWILPGENEKAERALKLLKPRIRKFYIAHYQIIGSREGKFVGLVCRCCNTWLNYNHSGDCPVSGMMVKKGESYLDACLRMGLVFKNPDNKDRLNPYIWVGNERFEELKQIGAIR